MTFPHHFWSRPLPLLDAEAWDCPDRFSPDDCLNETGADWCWTQAPFTDPEDDR